MKVLHLSDLARSSFGESVIQTRDQAAIQPFHAHVVPNVPNDSVGSEKALLDNRPVQQIALGVPLERRLDFGVAVLGSATARHS